MTDDCPHLGSEIENHKNNLNGWIEKIGTLRTPASQQGVNDRFVRDCKTLITDLDSADNPSTSDLNDFDDCANSLEVRFNQITDGQQ